MNTSVQVKTHTNKSASFRNVENLRESEQFKNPDIEVLLKTENYKFEDDVIEIPKADKKSENKRQDELRKVNNKINTYSKLGFHRFQSKLYYCLESMHHFHQILQIFQLYHLQK